MQPESRELEARLASLRELAGPAGFEPGFTDRVLSRLTRQPSLADGLQSMFFRLAPLATAAVLVVSAANLLATRSSGQPLLDRVLQLPAVNLAAAFNADLGVLLAAREETP